MNDEHHSGPIPPGAVPKHDGESRPRRGRWGTPRQPKDVDLAERARLLQGAAWSLYAGFAAAVATMLLGAPPALALLLGALFGSVTFLGATLIGTLAGRMAGKIYAPSGRSTPGKREYSYAESLAARGRYEDAVQAYRAAAEEFPDDPEPLLRAARLLRDELARYDDAIGFFKRARAVPASIGGALPWRRRRSWRST